MRPQRAPRQLSFWLALIFIFAPARVLPSDQFSTPYDPDFAPQQDASKTPQKPVPPAEIPAATPEETPGIELPLGETLEQPSVQILIPSYSGKFLLRERADKSHIFEQPESTAPVAVSTQTSRDFLDWEIAESSQEFRYSLEKYEHAKTDVDEGREPSEFDVTPIIPSTEVGLSTGGVPKPPPPEVELPTYGTSLSVTGRKVIGVSYSEKKFLNPQTTSGRPQSTNLIDITQQLQLRMQGKVGPKITVNVDYDDTKQNHQDISVVYTGDPNEVVQNVSFGDIDLSLPATEFVSYNKQLFGIRADVKFKGYKASFIGSRTKGTTKSRQFFGNQQFTNLDIPDAAYVRRTYYDLSFGLSTRLPIRSGSERVFLAQNSPGQVNTNNITLTVDDLQLQTSTVTASFSQLNAGVDYTIDYVRGIITFRNQMQSQFIVAVDYVDATGQHIDVEISSNSTAAGGSGRFKLIKTPGELPVECSSCTADEVGFNRELKTFYSLGQTQIVGDNGRGNFILKVLDQNRNEVGSTLNPLQKYPDTITVDFANGIFNLVKPFSVSNSSPTTPDPNIYAPTPIQNRILHAEFFYRFKTFFLEPNLVPQSEIVLLDNVKLTRNVDYFIDYDAGFVTFFNEDRIRQNSEIDISYEVAPFAGATTNDSLLGTRMSYEWGKHYELGSTLLYESGIKSQTTPSITELSRSLLVYDFDAHGIDFNIGKKFKVKLLGGEIAQSRSNLNLNSAAIIDNMEGVKLQDSAPTLASSWFIASNPGTGVGGTVGNPICSQANPCGTYSGGGDPGDASRMQWTSENIPALQINPNAPANSNQAQQVLDFSYDFSNANSQEESIVFPFSVVGNDFSQRTLLQIVMLGDLSGNDLNFRLGGIGDDMDDTGGVTLTCANGLTLKNAPKTEDIDCTGVLSPAKDVGWSFTNPPGALAAATVFGANNGRLDSENLRGDFRLDPDDGNGNNFGYAGDLTGLNPSSNILAATDGTNHTTIDFGGNTNAGPWTTFQIPLMISTATISRWTNIRQIRISVRHHAGGKVTGILKFASLSIIGNTWQAGQPFDPLTNNSPVGTESLLVTPVNNVDNPGYVPIYNAGGDASQVFNDLYGSLSNLQKQQNTTNVSEQALQLTFSSMTINTATGQKPVVTTKRLFGRPIDISQHRYFNFLLYSNVGNPSNPNGNGTPCAALNSGAGTIVVGGGVNRNKPNCTDHTFFLRVGNDTNFWEVDVPLNFVGWREIRVQQQDSAHNSVADVWQANTPGTVVLSTGVPSLQQVAEIVAGVIKSTDATGGKTGANDNPTFGTVFLNEIHVSQPIPRVGTAEKLEATFEVPGWATFGGKFRSIDRNFQTPTSVVLNQDNEQDTAFLNFTRLSYLPMTFNLSRNVTDTPSTALVGSLSNSVNLLQQGKVINLTGSAQGNFSLGALPRVNLGYQRNRINYNLLTRTDDRQTYTGTFQYGVPSRSRFLPKTIDLNYSYSRYTVNFQSLQALLLPGDFNTSELTQTLGTRLTFTPWNGSSFNPNFSLTKVSETRDDFTGDNTAPAGVGVHLKYQKSQNETAGFSSNYRLLSWLNPQLNYSANIIENEILNISTFVVANSTYVFNVGDIKTVNRNANGSISLPITIGEITKRTKLFRSLNIVSGYQLQDGDVTNQVESGLNTLSSLWVRTPLHPTNPAAVLQTQTLRDTFNSTQRWTPLDAYDLRGRWATFKTFNISNNFVESIQRNNTTGTRSRTTTLTLPDLVASISQLEKLIGTSKWMNSTQMNFKYSAHRTNNVGQSILTDGAVGTDLRSILFKRFDTLLSFNDRWSKNLNLLVNSSTQRTGHQDATVQTTFDIKKFRFTPKVDYSHDTTQDGFGNFTQDVKVITPSVLVRADLALPRGLLLPGSTKTILFSNRIIWTTTLSLAIRSSPVTVADNFKLATFNTSADYELAKNLRMTINGALSREWHRFLAEEDFIAYSFGMNLTFQF